MALVPIKIKDKIAGLIQLNDRRKGRFSLATIELMENIAAKIGVVLTRKQTEDQIETLARFPLESPNPVLRVSTRGTLQFANAAADTLLSTLGVAKTGDSINAEWQTHIDEAVAEAHPIPIEFSAAGNTFDATLVPVTEHSYVNLYARNITEQKRAEMALRASEAEFRSLAEAMPQIVWITRPDGWNIYISQQWVDYTGLTLEESLGHGWSAPFHPDDRQRARDAWQKALQNNGTYALECRLRRFDGVYHWWLIRAVPLLNQRGEILKWFGTCTDIEDFKQAALALEENEKVLVEAQSIARLGNYALDIPSNRWKSSVVLDEVFGISASYGHTLEGWLALIHPDDRAMMSDYLKNEVIGNRKPFNKEYRIIRQNDRAERWVHGLGRLELDETDAPVKLVGTIQDITERKRAEEMLTKTEAKHVKMVANIGDVIVIIDRDGINRYKSPNITKWFGWKPEEVVGSSTLGNVHPDDVDRTREFIGDLMREPNRTGTIECRYRCKDGTYKWIEFTGINLSHDSDIQGILGNYHDITERKQAGADLRQSEATIRNKLKAIIEPEGDIGTLELSDIIDTEVLQSIMEDFYQLTGMLGAVLDISGKVLVAVGWKDICTKFHRCHPDTLKNCIESDTLLTHGVSPGQFKAYKCKNNMWDMVTPLMVGGRHVGNVFIGQFFYEGEMPDMELFRQQARLCGFDEKEYLDALDRVPRFSREAVVAGMKFYAKLAGMISTMSFSAIQQSRMLAERKRAEDALHVSQQITEGIINSIPVRVFWKDRNLVYLGCNTAFARDAGFADPQDIIGKDDYQLLPAQAELYRADDRRVIESGEPFLNREEPLTTPEGNIITLLTSKMPLHNAQGQLDGVLGTYVDITPQRQMEEQFRQAQKMEAVGQLSGGIAHDFNNILQVILLFSELLMGRLKTDTKEYRDVSEIKKAADRAADLTRQLLTFSRKQPIDKKRTDLNALIQNIKGMFQTLLNPKTSLVLDLAQDLSPIDADSGQLEQLLMNLAVNARDAMPDRGQLTFKTENIQLSPADASATPEARYGDFVCLCVTDTGCGMSPHVKDHLFEPFFTTKEPGKGTGLGLSVIHGVVKQHGGWIQLDSEEGRGTTFKIYLPIYSENKTDAAPDAAPPEHILLVEDDPAMRNMVIHMLQGAGYQVSVAETTAEALALFDSQPDEFDLLFSDIVLPGKTGIELADDIRKKKPALPVLLYSGYQNERERWGNLDSKGYRFLQKPFTVIALMTAVHDAMTRATKSNGV